MKRWLPRILLCLVLGVVTTVGVAWAIAFRAIPEHDSWVGRVEVHEDSAWHVTQRHEPGMSIVSSALHSRDRYRVPRSDHPPSIPRWANVPRSFSEAFQPPQSAAATVATGWPLLAGSYDYVDYRDVSYHYIADVANGIPLDVEFHDYGMQRALPLRPILPGLIINTIFYTAVWFALLFGIRAQLPTHPQVAGVLPDVQLRPARRC